MQLQQDFPEELLMLRELFSVEKVKDSIDRLNEIYAFAEMSWEEYVSQIPNGIVKYLLITEAPPWRKSGPPFYVLDPVSPKRTIMRALRRTFLSENQATQFSTAEALLEFAQCGFLVMDSIPFAMKYTSRHRRKPKYQDLVAKSVKTYLRGKILSPCITWSPDVRVALGFKLNGIAVIKAHQGHLTLNNVNVKLAPESIAANGSGFPDAGRLKSIYGLS